MRTCGSAVTYTALYSIITGLPNPVGISVSFRGFFCFVFVFFFRVGKILACLSPTKWCLCAWSLLCVLC